ncbi:hypothetical protein Syun_021804 [Stephania yunnanensis]|uniref:Uncharacterized protein n=1 Tax=Stephania yunnanensis TaxID=152371 RepID=A0AAP0II80_9MAGN
MNGEGPSPAEERPERGATFLRRKLQRLLSFLGRRSNRQNHEDGITSSTQADVEMGEIPNNGQQALLMGESSPTDMNGEYSSPPNPQSLGLKVVGIWIVPTLIGAISYITQVAIGNQHAKPKQRLLLGICSGVALATCVVGGVLFIFCIIQWKKNSGRGSLITNCMIILGFGSAFMNIFVPVIAFGFLYSS